MKKQSNMKKIVKTALLIIVFLNSNSIFAQLQEYIENENNRILKAQQTEIEIERFINSNFKNYKLAKEITEELKEHLREEEEFSDEEFEIALINAKRHELRKLFFKQNPDYKEYYSAQAMPQSIAQDCVNGDFESGVAGYSFWSDNYAQPASGEDFFQSCSTVTERTASNVMTASTNNFGSRVNLINSAASGYQVNDPVLASFGVNVPTLNSNGGTRCIKLNNTGGYGSSDLTTLSRNFTTINQSTIDFNFSLIMDNKPEHGQEIQPFFRARVYDQFDNIVDEICIIANPDNCLFNIIYINSERRMLYTGWICARLNVESILNQPGRIEFTISDCQPSRHFGTVYIDNICGLTCAVPQLGALSLEPTNIVCPDLSDETPMSVCGTYQSPVNATLSTLVLYILQNDEIIGTINSPTLLTANTFCFTVLPSQFGVDPFGDYEFQVDATFNVVCPAGNFVYDITDYSANVGPDVTFVDCCKPTLTLTSPVDNVSNLDANIETQKERSDWIRATNIVEVGNNDFQDGVVYHSGNFVELNPGFEAVSGSQFAAYIEGCSDNYVYRYQNPNTSKTEPKEEEINLIRLGSGFKIVPNPSTGMFEIIMKDNTFKHYQITTIDGKVVQESSIQVTDKHQFDITRFSNGIYIINVVSENGEIQSQKLIKK